MTTTPWMIATRCWYAVSPRWRKLCWHLNETARPGALATPGRREKCRGPHLMRTTTMQLSPGTTDQGKRFKETSPEPQALKDYAQRIGAERRNFRRYVVREQERERRLGLYHIDRYIITISVDGEVTVR